MERKCVIIGSFRNNLEEIKTVAKIFEEKNIEVLSPSSFETVDPEKDFVILKSDEAGKSVKDIQTEVLEKMLMSDFIYLVNPNGRVGLSAAFEIGYAHSANLNVYSMELVDNLIIREFVKGVVPPEEI